MHSLNLNSAISKVNFQRILTAKRESTDVRDATLDARLGIIKDAWPRRLIFRELARRLRAEG